MREYFRDENTANECKIYRMLVEQSERHLSFHTPGHKVGGWDITELSYSDNLSAPKGCIKEAEEDVAKILGAKRSFLLTDGSTSGVLAMLYAAKACGVRTLAVCEASHKSLFNGAKVLGLELLVYPSFSKGKIPFAPTVSALNAAYGAIFKAADAVFLTSPDYYGNVADLAAWRKFCDEEKKLLLIDGAHGGHLHFDRAHYAGSVADLWVDGVHKSLPALTQGAVVSARTQDLAEALREGVDVFRTTSPSYPIMASVEYAVKYPRNVALEERVRVFTNNEERAYTNDDWTKLCVRFGKHAFEAEERLEARGIYPEFCDGNVVAFYLSPQTSEADFECLKKELSELFLRYPDWEAEEGEKGVQRNPAPSTFAKDEVERVKIEEAEGRICAADCGLFPPCTPLFRVGDRMDAEGLRLLARAHHAFGVSDGEVFALKRETERRKGL